MLARHLNTTHSRTRIFSQTYTSLEFCVVDAFVWCLVSFHCSDYKIGAIQIYLNGDIMRYIHSFIRQCTSSRDIVKLFVENTDG